MFNIGSWNLWGLNSFQKQKTVQEWTTKNNLDIFGLLETKITASNLDTIAPHIAISPWQYTTNITSSTSCRIFVSWNPHKLSLTHITSSAQWLTCEITTASSPSIIRITFVYGHNTPADRRTLWNYLSQESSQNTSIPWIVLGDFNAIMHAGDRAGGDTNWYSHLDDFPRCISLAELIPVPYTGMKFTWHNGQQGEQTIQKKLDWIFGNANMFSSFPAAHATFMPRHISDHSAMLLTLHSYDSPQQHHSPFKFLNAWADREDFTSVVSSLWSTPVAGNPIYQFTTKLRLLKTELRQYHRQHTSHISSRVAQARDAWYSAQASLDSNPMSATANTNERTSAKLYMQLCKDEESVLKQRSRVHWLQLGDKNTKFFHNSLLHRQVRNRVHSLKDDAGNLVTDSQEMGQMASTYYEKLLTAPQLPINRDAQQVFTRSISDESLLSLNLPITADEIKAALFSIPDNKSPGPDGYNAFFFKHCWSIIGADLIAAVRYFFNTSTMPRCVNATRIALVPKIANPSCLNDYRPISCCNVLYKCISKILVCRLKTVLVDVIGPSQSAFLPGRQISDAILLTQELMHNSHHQIGPPRCALKVDLRKAFDTVRWDFILAGLEAVGIPHHMIHWIHICISSAHYTINLNGALHGFFSATRGIRQGDPLSPYLFVLAMEGLGGIISQHTQHSKFKFHWRCAPNRITHLCFADDLMLYCHADAESVGILKSCMDKFSLLSGLTINHAKSSLYLSGVDEDLKHSICNQFGIQPGTLPIRYLGVPLISTRLTHADCVPLIERITSRIKLWTSSSLTYAGRLQLIKSVLFSIQVYWTSLFILPRTTIKKLESIFSAFLWKGSSLTHTGAKVAWQSICFPLREGGLGIKSLQTWNTAATMKHIWHLLVDKDSIWTVWVKTVLLRNRSLWQINIPSTPSWSWRKILQAREDCRGWFLSCIGNGFSTSLWFDYWLPEGKRLIDILPLRRLTSTGLSWNARVSDIIQGDQWVFPAISELQPAWAAINFHPHPTREDHCVWTGHHSGDFSIHSAWDILRDHRPTNIMHHLIWFKGHVPRQSFILWLAIHGRLRTMDRLHGVITDYTCVLCHLQVETHDHLFFACKYTSSVWGAVCNKANVYWPSIPWKPLLQWAAVHYQKKTDLHQMIARLLLSSTVYFLWHERNNRIFSNTAQTYQVIAEGIFQHIRTHISNMDNIGVIPQQILATWNLQAT